MKLTDHIATTAELCGTRLSEMAAQMLAEDLCEFPEADVIAALARCRRELKSRLTVAEVLSRIEDGRPGPDEAWGLLAWDEDTTIVMTDEMSHAQDVARSAYFCGDKIGARLAFRDAYTRMVNEARNRREPVQWSVSLGWDKEGRAPVVRDAVATGKITHREAEYALPGVTTETEETRRLPAMAKSKALPAPAAVPMPEEIRQLVGKIGKSMEGSHE